MGPPWSPRRRRRSHGRAGHRRSRAHEALRGHQGGRWDLLRGREGPDVRPPRAERRRQDDHGRDPRRVARPNLRGGSRPRRGRPERVQEDPEPGRRPAARFRTLRPPEAEGGGRLLGQALRPHLDQGGGRGPNPDRWIGGPRGHARDESLRRREAPPRHRDVPRREAETRLARRADARPRRLGAGANRGRHARDARETRGDRHAGDGNLHETREPRGCVPEGRRGANAGRGARRVSRILADVSAFGKMYLRSRVGTFFALAFPIILILLFGAIFSSSGSPQVPLYVQNKDCHPDCTPASLAFVEALNNTTLITYQGIPENAIFQDYIRQHSINVALQIPSGFQETLVRAGSGNASAQVNVLLAGDQTQSSYGIAYSAVAGVATGFNLKIANATKVVDVAQ